MQLDGLRHLVLVDAKAPVSFFAYPDKPSDLVPEGCEVHVLASGADDAELALEQLADALGAANDAATAAPVARPDAAEWCIDRGDHRPGHRRAPSRGRDRLRRSQHVGAVRADADRRRAPHDWLTLTGGAIGQGLPVATGAAVACPDRKVVALEADGSAMYTLQALWTQAREGLDVTTVIFGNRSYAILNLELSRVGAEEPGPKALDMLDISRPDLDFVALATGDGRTCESGRHGRRVRRAVRAGDGRTRPAPHRHRDPPGLLTRRRPRQHRADG